MQDHNLIAKLSEGDLIALGDAYHTQCLVSLYNRDRDIPQISGNSDTKLGVTQVSFLKDVKSLTKTVSEMGNPFSESSGDLIVLDSRQLVDDAVVASVRKVESLGQQQCKEFFADRLLHCTTPLDAKITKNNLQLFGNHEGKSRTQVKFESIKHDRHLFSTLFIASQAREADIDEFFRHENQSFPPSLSDNGRLRSKTKSDLLQCLEELIPPNDVKTNVESNVDFVVVDGAALVNMLKPAATSQTFHDYVIQFMAYIQRQFTATVRRVDVVFDQYRIDSLKAEARKKRGKGFRIRVDGTKKIPGNWQQFLREDGNKTKLFRLISQQVAKQQIRTVDSDVVVLVISFANGIECEKLTVAFGISKSFRYLDVSRMALVLGNRESHVLPVFHALTGCDTTSSFAGRGKRTAWTTWSKFADVSPALRKFAQAPTAADVEEVIPDIERFVVLMYDQGSLDDSVNKARKTLFTSKKREIENIPPTQDASAIMFSG